MAGVAEYVRDNDADLGAGFIGEIDFSMQSRDESFYYRKARVCLAGCVEVLWKASTAVLHRQVHRVVFSASIFFNLHLQMNIVCR